MRLSREPEDNSSFAGTMLAGETKTPDLGRGFCLLVFIIAKQVFQTRFAP